MKSWKIIIAFVNILLIISLCNCVPEEVILHGDISGFVTDADSNQPLQDASISANQSTVLKDAARTESDGLYLIKNLSEGSYEIQASMPAYGNVTKTASVVPAENTEIDFALSMVPFPVFSDTCVDFGFDSTVISFTISNGGAGTLRFSLLPSVDWITVEPNLGEVTTEKETITVTIDRTGLAENKQEETITITSDIGEETQQDKVHVLANGVSDQDGNYYGAVTIGTQTWLAENLKTGKMINWSVENRTTDDSIIEKYCYDNIITNCNIYGGLYSWFEMRDYVLPDSGSLVTVQGICPAGWHIPTFHEWHTLFTYLGGFSAAGGMLKETGTIEDGTGHWKAPNEGATNESGFTALPGGYIWVDELPFTMRKLGEGTQYWTSQDYLGDPISYAYITMSFDNSGIVFGSDPDIANPVASVRCIKDP